MRELAKMANVSVSTVSKAFSDAEDVSADTKRAIIELAKETGCYGRFNKGKYSKKIIAIICPEFESSYYTGFVVRLQSIIESHGGIAAVLAYHFNFRLQSELIDYCCSYMKVDGIITFCLKEPLKKGCDLPIVNLFSKSDRNIDEITEDTDDAIAEAVRVLYEKGHRNMAFIGEKLTRSRAQSFLAAVGKRSDCSPFVYESSLRFEKAGEEGADGVLRSFRKCTALICAYDNIAFGAMKRLKNRGFGIPEDFSVIGVDNLNFGQYTDATLSSIGCDPDEICQLAWELLEKRLKNNRAGCKRQIVMKCRVFLRDSVAQARSKTIAQQ